MQGSVKRITALNLNRLHFLLLLFGVTHRRLHIITPSPRLTSYFIQSKVAELTYIRRRPAVQPVQSVGLRFNGPLLTVRTALASWVTKHYGWVHGCVSLPYVLG